MKTIAISEDVWGELEKSVPPNTRVITLNLLRFREETQYPANCEFTPCNGREAYYKRYAAKTVPIALARGGKIVLSGSALGHPVCPPDERWDDILIFEYPNISALAGLGSEAEYKANAVHRTASLADSRLLIIARNELVG